MVWARFSLILFSFTSVSVTLLELTAFYIPRATANQAPYDFPNSKRSQIAGLYMKCFKFTKAEV